MNAKIKKYIQQLAIFLFLSTPLGAGGAGWYDPQDCDEFAVLAQKFASMETQEINEFLENFWKEEIPLNLKIKTLRALNFGQGNTENEAYSRAKEVCEYRDGEFI